MTIAIATDPSGQLHRLVPILSSHVEGNEHRDRMAKGYDKCHT